MRSNSLSPELFDAARDGHADALDALLETWTPVIYEWCARLGGPQVDAEDAAHDVLLVLVAKLSTVANQDAFPSWMYGVTRKVLAQHRRRAWVRRWVPGASYDQVDTSERPVEIAARNQAIRRVQELLQRLPERAREVLVLCDLEERSEAEVAALLGVPKGTVKSRLHRARARLRADAERAGVVPSTLLVLHGGGS